MDFKSINVLLKEQYDEKGDHSLIKKVLELHREVIDEEILGNRTLRKSYEMDYIIMLLENRGYKLKERKVLFIEEPHTGQIHQSITSPF